MQCHIFNCLSVHRVPLKRPFRPLYLDLFADTLKLDSSYLSFPLQIFIKYFFQSSSSPHLLPLTLFLNPVLAQAPIQPTVCQSHPENWNLVLPLCSSVCTFSLIKCVPTVMWGRFTIQPNYIQKLYLFFNISLYMNIEQQIFFCAQRSILCRDSFTQKSPNAFVNSETNLSP